MISSVLIASLCLALGASARAPAGGGMRTAITEFEADRDELSALYPVDASAASQTRMAALYSDWTARLAKVNFSGLSPEGRADYVMFEGALRHFSRELALRTAESAKVATYAPFAPPLYGLEEARLKMAPVDPEVAAKLLAHAVEAIGAAKTALAAMKQPDKHAADQAVRLVRSTRSALASWHGFYDGYDPLFAWWADAPYKAVDQALQEYVGFLREKVIGVAAGDEDAIVGDPVGRARLQADLDAAMIPYTPEQLIDIAERQYAWCVAEMKKASRELGDGDDWKKALEFVKRQHVGPGEQPALIKRLSDEAIAFVKAHDLVTVPPIAEETLRMEMMSPERQLVNPFFLGGDLIIVSYPTSGMSEEQKQMSMRANNRYFARATVFHELIPGHHLQGWAEARFRPYRSLFYTPFWVEGNAVYWEMRLWDLGFDKTPEERIGALFWLMHRCMRVVFSLKFHLGEMTAEQCVQLLIDRVGHERASAEGEVRRSLNGDYEPLYQVAYLIGALQFRALRHELVDSGKMTDRAFNDAVLRENAIPVPMLRAILTGEPLSPSGPAPWRFAEELPPRG